MIKLDLGAGQSSPPGYRPLGHDHGTEIYPLPYDDGTVDDIRCSHTLEHFSHKEIGDVVKDWVRALKKGGRIRIAVPDYAKLAKGYVEGKQMPYEGYLLGGQDNQDDFHKSLFDRDRLRKIMAEAGLVLLRPWKSEIEDCAAYDISLNIEGYKPYVDELRVSGAMSVPRLGFMENMFCAMEAVIPCNVKFRKHGGAFWGQSLTHAFERILEEDDPDCILTVDYDSIFTPGHLAHLMQIMMLHPEIDALAPIQSSRHIKSALFTVREGENGENKDGLPRTSLQPETMPVSTAHFGLTLIRCDKLKKLPKPWFHSTPSPKGDWHDGKVDEDIEFWRKWERAGFALHLANRVAIGHAELMIRWPDINLEAFYQSTTEFQQTGVPEGVWK